MNEQINYLLLAKALLDGTGKDPTVDKVGSAQVTQAAAQIAIAEQLAAHNEHLAFIRGHLDDIASVLLNAAGPDGAIKIDVLGG